MNPSMGLGGDSCRRHSRKDRYQRRQLQQYLDVRKAFRATIDGAPAYNRRMPEITLPDGSRRSYDAPPSVADVAADIGPGLARAALAGRVGGELVDTDFRIENDADVAIVTARDADGLEILRHSTAHLLAQAVQELFPGAQVTIGPVIEDGFYYDFSYERGFTPEDLERIEKRMKELAKADLPVSRETVVRDDAVEFFRSIGEHYKAEIIAGIPADEAITLYGQGEWKDLCRGPHVPSTGQPQGLQADPHRRRLLARGFVQRATAAHLRHRLGRFEVAQGLPQAPGGSRKA